VLSAHSNHQDFVLIGAGGHAAVVSDVVASLGRTVLGYVAPERTRHLDDVPWIGTDAELPLVGLDCCFALALGAVGLRRRIVERLAEPDARWPLLVHSTGYVASSAWLGAGVQIMARSVVQPAVSVGDHCIINTGAIIEHASSIGAFTHVAGGVVLGGEVSVGEEVLIGLGAVVLPGVRVGHGATIGAGAVVCKDVAEGELVMGVPARAR
jgi:sugar O-acyltransferase (sialic acid O-acetyltransferase NeuD family)